VVRERQRQTLESLLTIPVDRRAILWPKWLVSFSKGWWWGVPGTVSLPIAFLVSVVPAAALPTAAYVAAAIPFTVSLGLWLSVRCRTITRAVLWLLPAIGGLTLFPVLVWAASDTPDMLPATVVVAVAAVAVGAAAWVFWRLSVAAFENEGRG
jgi:ABC-type Na+ efflux pump permease subunit